jgi:hypothetical protein
MATIFPDLEQKITGSEIWDGFGTDLGDPNIWISGYLGRTAISSDYAIIVWLRSR